MKLIHILPMSNLHYCDNYKYFMALTHLVESNVVYREWLKRYKGYTILDNSIVELGDAVDIARVCDAAELINADEIILPDVMEDGVATCAKVAEAIDYLFKRYGREWPFKIQAVVQGKTYEEVEECFNQLEDNPDIDVIGIPKHLSNKHPFGRVGFEKLWMHSDKKIHLLGLADTFTELAQYKYPDNIRTCDTSLLTVLIKTATNLGAFRPLGAKIDFETDFIGEELFREDEHIVDMMRCAGYINAAEGLV